MDGWKDEWMDTDEWMDRWMVKMGWIQWDGMGWNGMDQWIDRPTKKIEKILSR